MNAQESEKESESGSSTESSSSRMPRNLNNLNANANVKKVQVVKTKEYKIPRHKKHTSYKKCSFCLKKIPTQKDLNDHTSIDHDNYCFLCKHRKCGKSFISESGLKRHERQHSSMDYASTQGVMGHTKQKQSTGDIIKLTGLPVMITKHLTNVNI